ncbi:MAG: FixH family protein [Neisseriaceae bacterium]|nr:FixH family protein [Neisseriaceae bacterium]
MMNQEKEISPRPWYKEPWTWGLMAGPAIVVVAGLITFKIATDAPDDLVTDDYYKEGKNIVQQMERDEKALNQHMNAQVYVQPDKKGVMIIVSGEYNTQTPLQLLLIHPTRKAMDRTIDLQQNENNPLQYTAQWEEALPATNNWIVRLQDTQNEWRIENRWIVSQGDAVQLIAQRMGSAHRKTNKIESF